MATLYNITEITKGDYFTGLKFIATDENGAAINLTGCTFDLWIRYDNATGRVIKRMSIDNGITILNAAAGSFQIDKYKVTFNAGKYYYDMRYTDSSSEGATWIFGEWLINEDSSDN